VEENIKLCAMIQEARRRPRLGEVRLRSQVSTCGICGRLRRIGTDLSTYLGFTCHYHPTNSPYPFICLTLNLSKWQRLWRRQKNSV